MNKYTVVALDMMTEKTVIVHVRAKYPKAAERQVRNANEYAHVVAVFEGHLNPVFEA